MSNYFVTIDGLEIARNISKQQAIDLANEQYKVVKSTLRIGIGKTKRVNGRLVYTCVPAHFCTA